MDVALLREYADSGMTRTEIAERMEVPYSTLASTIIKYGIHVIRKKTVQPKRGPTKQTKQIIELRKAGKTYKEIMAILGCCKETVNDACVKYGLKKQQVITESQAKSIIELAGYDYVSGFVNTHSTIIVRCRTCGREIKRTYANIRKQLEGKYQCKPECYECKRIESENKQQILEEAKEREAQMKAKRKAEQLSRKANDELVKRLATHVCKNCGQQYCMAVTGYNSELYCSKRCQDRWHDRIKNDRRLRRMSGRKHDTDITLEKLFQRDAGVCYLCGKACDWSDIEDKDGAMIAGGTYPSIDHVKPISKGGLHTWDNIRLACRACNTKKGWT